jgi:FtsZ-binding cell division protein ZapB
MTFRDSLKERTALRIREAIERIKLGQPKNRELKKRKNLKLNKSTVEKEADLSTGALRHYPEIIKEINDYQPALKEISASFSDDSDASLILLQQEHAKLKQQKKLVNKAKVEESSKAKNLADEIERLKHENVAIHQYYTKTIAALFELVPQEKRHLLLSELRVSTASDKVVPIKR